MDCRTKYSIQHLMYGNDNIIPENNGKMCWEIRYKPWWAWWWLEDRTEYASEELALEAIDKATRILNKVITYD